MPTMITDTKTDHESPPAYNPDHGNMHHPYPPAPTPAEYPNY